MKKGIIFETLGSTDNLQITESKDNGEIRLHGVFGVCGVKNNNNRIYEKRNYGMCVEELQSRIASKGVLGELEHPNSFNINLNNVSHKIESIQMNEDGTITGTILLLDTAKGRDAKAIVEGGCPLFISSRAAGQVDAKGNVTLQSIATYDLVGTPGFSEARLNLTKSQKFECLTESVDGSNGMWMIVESEDADEKPKELPVEKPKEPSVEKTDKPEDHKPEDHKELSPVKKTEVELKDEKADKPLPSGDDASKNGPEKPHEDTVEDDKIKHDNEMQEIKDSIDALTKKVAELEATLHITKESLDKKSQDLERLQESYNTLMEQVETVDNTDYKGIQNWVEEHFAQELKKDILAESTVDAKSMIMESIIPAVEKWITEHYSKEVENWIVNEFAPQIQAWIVEEYSPELSKWLTEEFAPEIQNWIVEEVAPTFDKWVNEECLPEYKQAIMEEMTQNVSAFLEAQKESKFSDIDKMLESLSTANEQTAVKMLNESVADKFAGIPAVEMMPAKYKPMWAGLSESKQEEIARSSRLYDFTKKGVLESFWANAFSKGNVITESSANVEIDPAKNRLNAIAKLMHKLR